jgi:hypothetical protein
MPKRAKVKLTKIEKLDRDIRLAYRKQERAMDMLKKGERMLKTSASDLARLNKKKARLESEQFLWAKAHESTLETAAGGVRFGPDEAVKRPQDVEPPKPKRRRKAPPGSEQAALQHTPPSANLPPPDFVKRQLDRAREAEASVEDREARMKSLGFRQTSNRRKPPSVGQ